MTPKIKLIFAGVVMLAAAAVAFSITQHREVARLRDELAKREGRAPSGAVAGSRRGQAVPVRAVDLASLSQALKEDGQSRIQKMRGLVEYAAGLAPDQIGGVLDAVNKSPKSSYTAMLKQLLLARWTDDNPSLALAWAKSQTNRDDRAADMRSVLEAWADKDITAAAMAINQVDDGPAREAVAMSLFSRLAQRDASAALNTLLTLPIGQRTPELYGAVFSAWAAQDPKAATEAAMNLPPSKGRLEALTMLARSWVGQDSASALAWADALPPGNVRNDVISSALDSLAKQDPKAAVNYYGNLTSAADKATLLNTIAASWATQDPAGALAWVQATASGQVGDRAVQSVLAQMAQADPAGAADFLAKMPDATVRDGVLPQLATTWAQKDIQGALKWVEGLPESDGVARAEAYQDVLRTWAQTDPVSAAAYAGNNTTNPNFRAIADEVARNWAAADPAAAIAWINSLPDGGPKENAIRTALSTYAASDPQDAWNYAAQNLADDSPDGIRAKTLANIISAWGTLDPAGAAAMVFELPPANQSPAISAVASNWLKQDPLAASQWITTLPPGPPRDSAVVQLIAVEGKNDLPDAFNWALSVSGPGTRGSSLMTVVRMWAQRAPNNPAVIDTINAADIPDGQREQLLQTFSTYSKQAGRMPTPAR